MLKKIFGVTAVAFLATAAVACSGTGSSDSGETGNATETSVTVSDSNSSNASAESLGFSPEAEGAEIDYSKDAEEYKKHLKLANYKGIDVTKVDRSDETVTDEDAQEQMEMLVDGLKTYDEITDGSAQEGDMLTMDIEGTVDGQKIDELTAEEMTYEVGEGMFLEEFDEQLVGKKAGEDFEIKVTFPEDYLEEEWLADGEFNYNGKEAVFKANIAKIERPHEEELTDDWVKAHQDDLSMYDLDGTSTVAELKEKIKIENAAAAKESNDYLIGSEALNTVTEESEAESYPEEELNELKAELIEGIEQEYEAYKDSYDTIEDFLKDFYGIEGDNPKETYADEQAKGYLLQKMVVTLIAYENGIKIGEDEVKATGDEAAAYYGLDNYEALVDQFGDVAERNFTYQTMYNKVISYLATVSNPVLDIEYEEDLVEEGLEPVG